MPPDRASVGPFKFEGGKPLSHLAKALFWTNSVGLLRNSNCVSTRNAVSQAESLSNGPAANSRTFCAIPGRKPPGLCSLSLNSSRASVWMQNCF